MDREVVKNEVKRGLNGMGDVGEVIEHRCDSELGDCSDMGQTDMGDHSAGSGCRGTRLRFYNF